MNVEVAVDPKYAVPVLEKREEEALVNVASAEKALVPENVLLLWVKQDQEFPLYSFQQVREIS